MRLSESEIKDLDEILIKCLRCGLCLPVCPTYSLTYQEQSSPRGRIKLIGSVLSGKSLVSDAFADEMYFCLDCQACQTACPAGVRYGRLIEEARCVVADEKREALSVRLLKKIMLDLILSSRSRTLAAARILRFYSRSGLKEAVEESHILKLVSESLDEKQRLMPAIDDSFFDESVPELVKPKGKVRGRVAFLSGCIMNVAFARTHTDALAVLLKNGFEVVIPTSQVCCGSLHAHNGEITAAKSLARKNIQIFEKHSFDALVVDSAGCGAFIKEYGRLLQDDPSFRERAESLSKKTKDISEFLSEAGIVKPENAVRKRVTYHEACHLVHTQKISRQPRQLLLSIPGLEFIELNESTWCCGSAGIFNVLRFDDSMEMLDRKMNNILETGAEIVVTSNPGCQLQLQYGIRRLGLGLEVMHPVSLLRASYEGPG